MNSSIQAAFFDLDGTLLNTLQDLASSMNEVLEHQGCPQHSVQSYRAFIGDGVHMLVHRALPERMRSQDTVQACVQAFRETYARRWQESTQPYPGIKGLLQALDEQSIHLGVVTNKPHDSAVACIQAYFPQVPFRVIVDQAEGIPPKPDPTALIQAMRACGTAAERCVYIGDSGVDVLAGQRAGALAVGAAWGFRSRQELVEHGADHVLEAPLDFLRILEGGHARLPSSRKREAQGWLG